MKDSKPYIRHHAVIGYEYMPGTRLTLPRPGGGHYTLEVNSAGIRSSREYSLRKPPGTFRILVFGDSYAAGQYVANDLRFSEIMERRVPGLEVINFGLEGTGTDQQCLLYEHQGRKYEHDLVLLLPFLQNIRRNMVEARTSWDPASGREVLIPKPRFELVDGQLALRNVPVPSERPFIEEGDHALRNTDVAFGHLSRLKSSLSRVSLVRALKSLAYPLLRYEPFPEYKSPASPQWRLMASIIARFQALAGSAPLVLVPIFYASYVRYRMGRSYWDRFRSLDDGHRVFAVDVLPHFRSLGREAVRCFQEPFDPHFSPDGHMVLAGAILSELSQRHLAVDRE